MLAVCRRMSPQRILANSVWRAPSRALRSGNATCGCFLDLRGCCVHLPGEPPPGRPVPGGTCDLGRLCSCLSPPSRRPPGPRSQNSRHHGAKELSVSFRTLLSGSS